ncbi:MAG: S-adenosylmethionine:tRNA ribosyltransferase-isomerase [Polyangia bacterium]
MNPARAPRERRSDARLLALDADAGRHADLGAADLPSLLRPRDLLVVNDAATLPASLHGRTAGGAEVELRLLGAAALPGGTGDGAVAAGADAEDFWAVLFGAGDWRTPTEHRPPPPPLERGDVIQLEGREGRGETEPAELLATVEERAAVSPRLVRVRFSRRGAALWSALYRLGRPVQYAYLREPLALWSVQTAYAARPWAAEMPSAGRPLSWEILFALRRRGIELCALTHAAGLSSTGEPALDRALPLPERYDLPAATVQAVAAARARGGRVIAVGTTVVRALEGAARALERSGAAPGTLRPGSGVTELLLTPATELRVCDGILTGIHGPGESHFRLLAAFCPTEALAAAWEHAGRAGYLCHEFGDLSLIARGLVEQRPDAGWHGGAPASGPALAA